ncbi:hypothetical protein ACQ4M3_05520 [Leptolyngbya sp. AN03gr2]|uniref:hypothetical protein n=1 Tax=unclassified Leptolyngbya TaxID=2650499 RepID=UPI003D318D4E
MAFIASNRIVAIAKSFGFSLAAIALTAIISSSIATPAALAQPSLAPEVQAAQQALQKDMDYPSKARDQYGIGQVTKISVLPPYAIATWTWGPTGGWAILIQRRSGWQVVTRRDDWIGLQGVVKFGIPEATAVKLLDQVIPDWRSLPSE